MTSTDKLFDLVHEDLQQDLLSMSNEEVEQELKARGVDTKPLLDAIKARIKEAKDAQAE